MKRALRNIWAKTDRSLERRWHPLILHMLDVAASTDAILAREPESTRKRMAAILGMEWKEARIWLLVLIACHDLGKACPEFQSKWPELLASLGLRLPRSPNTKINHGFVSRIALSTCLKELGWPDELADLAADAVGCHHGERVSQRKLDLLEGQILPNSRDPWKNDWHMVRRQLFDAVREVFGPTAQPTKETLTGPDFMLLSGLAGFADWIGSNEEWFPFGNFTDCEILGEWFNKRRKCADQALDAIGWQARMPLMEEPKTFEQVFGFASRPLQKAIADALEILTHPGTVLVEAPMGEGKTEAAFYAHLELQRRFGHRGMYVALPTKATGSAMFKRTREFLQGQSSGRILDLQLLHGASLLDDTFQSMRFAGIHDPSQEGDVRAGEWFTHKKRALLSEYGVGTVDQALLPILPVRHHFVRLWGLANRVVILDEIHAYDAYTGTLLLHLLRWLLALESSVILLSATLPPTVRRGLAQIVGRSLPEQEAAYPRISIFSTHEDVRQMHFPGDSERRQNLRLFAISPEFSRIKSRMVEHLSGGGMGLALVNTVQRAQGLYRSFPDGEPLEREGRRVGKRLGDGTEIYLFHARFPADGRRQREEMALETFGKGGNRTGRKILIATQVAEQSLDLDFDLIVTDLAPIDLVLQRAGRLWRHAVNHPARKIDTPTLLVAGLNGEEPPSFDKPLWWSAVYREDILLRTWSLLHPLKTLTLPDDIDPLVQAVYEETVEVPASLQEWLDRSVMAGEGKNYAQKILADQAILGSPDDESWNRPDVFVLQDEDEPGVHRTLRAKTRDGEDSVVAVPLWPGDAFSGETTPDFATAKRWYLRAVSISRKSVVQRLRTFGVPEGWKKSPLLRNCIPLLLDTRGCWMEDSTVRLDEDLGLVYEAKEDE